MARSVGKRGIGKKRNNVVARIEKQEMKGQQSGNQSERDEQGRAEIGRAHV